ncbi:MAG: nuclease A inhibitor family protein [Thermoleophilaceae bacterium]
MPARRPRRPRRPRRRDGADAAPRPRSPRRRRASGLWPRLLERIRPTLRVLLDRGTRWWLDRAISAEQFARLVGAPPGTPAGERDLDAFLARHLERSDPYDTEAQRLRPRYEQLKTALRTTLADVRVFRVGAVEVRCYIVGRTPNNSLAGLVTTAVET